MRHRAGGDKAVKRIFCLIFTFMLALTAGCRANDYQLIKIPERTSVPTDSATATPAATHTQYATAELTSDPTPEPTPEVQRMTIGFIGDILMMTRQINDAKTDAGYDFSESFALIKDVFSSVDIMCANFEGTFGGNDTPYTQPRETMPPATEDNPNPTRPPFQTFSSPDELATNLFDAGIDAITLANNHSLDRDDAGLFRTIRVLRAAGIKTVGTALDENDFITPCLIEQNGITVGLVGATDVLNSTAPSIDKENRAFALTWLTEQMVKTQITACKQAGAEFIIIMVHWGYEHHSEESNDQHKQAELLIEWGADAIIGSHSHCPQPMEWITALRDGEEVTVPVAYSLGNFISNMAQDNAKYGVLARLTLERDELGVHCTELACLPLYCSRTATETHPRQVHRVLPCFYEGGTIVNDFGADESTLRSMYKAYEHVNAVCIGERNDIHLIERSEIYAGEA